jgi:hypothetical protein
VRLGRRSRLALVAVLVALAGGLVVFAIEAWRLPATGRSRDARMLAAGGPGSAWSGPVGLTTTLLGAREDIDFRRALVLFLRARTSLDPTQARTPDVVVQAVEAGAALGRIETSGTGRQRRSLAANLEAVLAGEGAEVDDNLPELGRAADLLRTAIRLDRSNDAAKANLERLLDRQGDSLDSPPMRATRSGGNIAGASPVEEGY